MQRFERAHSPVMTIVGALSPSQALTKVRYGDGAGVVLRDVEKASDIEAGDGGKGAKDALDGVGRIIETVEKGGGGRGPFGKVLEDALIEIEVFRLYGTWHCSGVDGRTGRLD